MTGKISIVIPTYNGEDLLVDNLPKIIKLFPEQEIIVVDDGSTDNSFRIVRNIKLQAPLNQNKFYSGQANNKQLRIIRNKINLGFASSANKGIMVAKNPIVLLLNNDCIPEKDFTSLIIPYFKDDKTFAVSCLEKTGKEIRGRPARQRGRGIGGFNQGLLFHQQGQLNKNNTLWAFGAAAIYNLQIFKKLGGFDENFNPFYWEDFDLSYRALKSGYKIFFEKKAVVYHQAASTINRLYSPQQIEIISFRNQLLTCWKNLTDKNLIFKHLVFLPYHLILTSIQSQGTFTKAFFEALIKIKSIWEKRNKNHFILSDKEVLAPFQKEIIK